MKLGPNVQACVETLAALPREERLAKIDEIFAPTFGPYMVRLDI